MEKNLVMKDTENFIHFVNPGPEQLHHRPEDFLAQLDAPTLIDVEGHDPKRCRVISSLIHGNEPSGFMALHRWLCEGHKPATNLRIILPSVAAAQAQPLFSHRHLPHEADLNRCFHLDGEGLIIQRAQQIKNLIHECDPEAVIDLHNTSGMGPAFAVTTRDDGQSRTLISYFCPLAILTGLKVGSLMEEEFNCPIVTIECGGAQDESAHDLAYEGIKKFTEHHDIFSPQSEIPVEVMHHPMRIEVREPVRIAYHTERIDTVDICLFSHIENYNQGLTPKGTALGWLNSHDLGDIIVRDEQGAELPAELFRLKKNQLITRHDMNIFMATTDMDIAKEDCLFYAIIKE